MGDVEKEGDLKDVGGDPTVVVEEDSDLELHACLGLPPFADEEVASEEVGFEVRDEPCERGAGHSVARFISFRSGGTRDRYPPEVLLEVIIPTCQQKREGVSRFLDVVRTSRPSPARHCESCLLRIICCC